MKEGDDPAAAVAAFAGRGISLIIADLPPDMLLKAADAARNLVFFNAGATDDRLREEDCRANVIHTAPTRSMLADGLAQYLIWKKWRRWLLVAGSHDKDKLFADALRRAATRFGAKIVQERTFQDTGGARRTDSGIVQIQRQIPVFTQSAPDYDVLVAADESEVFASYLPYRTWDPRPVAGSAGLVPTSWDRRARSMGREPVAESLRRAVLAPHERARRQGVGRRAHDRRGGLARSHQGSGDDDGASSRVRTSRSLPSRGRS